ncbi:hypothetical protein BRADI_2g14685v3 [Brachypodium distachyon]|uniref:Uncharacterized protein n=1 Tax=Brachypodium distachyon TaxID=15368 RepID=A0A2K2D8N9_BRADI|nr:hypothetical protein BRADI_2g14685v3 [Brachypodium distachyon]PNT70627.1 hypothetical protein BRADI_2g14685v3 [Brachypodium distachyon]
MDRTRGFDFLVPSLLEKKRERVQSKGGMEMFERILACISGPIRAPGVSDSTRHRPHLPGTRHRDRCTCKLLFGMYVRIFV